MIRNVWSVLCTMAIENKRTNNTVLIETIEKIALQIRPEYVSQVYNVLFKFVLATYWYNDDKDNNRTGTCRITFVTPSGRKSKPTEIALDLTPNGYHKWFINIHTIEVDGEGVYNIQVDLKEDGKSRWKRVAITPIQIAYKIDDNAPMMQSVPPPDDDEEAES